MYPDEAAAGVSKGESDRERVMYLCTCEDEGMREERLNWRELHPFA